MQGDHAKNKDSNSAVRVNQYTALFLMRQLQDNADTSDALPAIVYMDLKDRDFVELTKDDVVRLNNCITVMRELLLDKTASAKQMQSALTADAYAQYQQSFELEVSPYEDQWTNKPYQVTAYLEHISKGDLLAGLAERITSRARYSTKPKQYNSNGVSKSAELWNKAEKYFESALMYLEGECENSATAAELQQWFDRELNFDTETSTLSPSPPGVPRVRGSVSHNCLDKTRNLWGAKKSKHYRQREAICDAVYSLLFVDEVESVATVNVSRKLTELLKEINPEIDWD